ncbi:MAG TPA: hypothetical protein VF681_12850 [Abditibacteriaceae bacterium]|jgi:hypothetical protein
MTLTKRFALLAVLAAIMGGTALTGCGGGDDTETTEKTTEKADGTTEKSTTTAEKED